MATKTQRLAVEIVTEADKAKRDMAELDKAAKSLEGKPIEIPVDVTGTEGVKAKVGDVSRAADGAKNAFANLAGNTAQDMGSMLGPLGGVGVAIGQITEYTADARLGGEAMGSALKGAASMAGPLAALSLATLAATNAIERHKARQAELAKINAELVESFIDGTGAVEDFGDALDEAFSSGTASTVQTMTKLLSDRLKPEEFNKVATAFGEIGLSMEDLGDVIPAVDADFRAFAATQLKQVGLSDKQAEAAARLIDEYDHMTSLSGDLAGQTVLGDSFSPEQTARIDKMTHGLQELADQAQNVELQGVARDALNAARAFDEAGVAAAEAGGGLPLEQYARYSKAQQENTRVAEENKRMQEEGAAAAAESGTILDQVGRQVAGAADAAAEAMDKAKKAQDDWLTQNVDYQATVDDFTESLLKLGDGVEKQMKAHDEHTGALEGNSEAALANRDALGAVYEKAVAMNGAMLDAGFSVEGADQAMQNAAESAYQMVLEMGYAPEVAQQIKDKILDIPTLVNTEVKYTEKGYEERLAEMERLERDIHNTVFFAGVVDRELQRTIQGLQLGFNSVVTPSGAAAGPQAGGLAVVPMTGPAAHTAPSGGVATVNVNLSGGIVADTFQLQRVVERAVRSGARLGGTRR